MRENIWGEYIEKTRDSLPRPSLVEAIKLVKAKNRALDLGSGPMNDVRYLVSVGFDHITAVDSNQVPEDVLVEFPEEKVSFVLKPFDSFNFPEDTYDLVNAQYSLSYNSPETFNELMKSIQRSLKVGGLFVGQFYGIRDYRAENERSMTFLKRAEAEDLLAGYRIASFIEKELDTKTVMSGEKLEHCHFFEFTVVK